MQQSIPETDLIVQAQNGSAQAFGELYQLHLDALYRYVYSRVGETSEAENLTQTIFMKAWQSLGKYRRSHVPFRAWLYRIAHNTVIDHYRTVKSPEPLPDHDLRSNGRTPEDLVLSQERCVVLRSAITQLKPNYQQVLTLRFLNELDYSETAEIMGRNVNTVRVLQFRALKALQVVLAQESMQPEELS
ncbi:MAG: sigma-70 family RNA polymerase sigma factor [Chloroflexi bacterium]|nr:sigma-70 family RNA polymerase sigma factor [Chloroflexota bacterium]